MMVDAAPINETCATPRCRRRRRCRRACVRRAGGMRGAADRCQRIGACRKTGSGVMCPSYMATREEARHARARERAGEGALGARPAGRAGRRRLHEVLDLCLECKACKSECPLSVDMASLKAEFLSHYQDAHGMPLRSRLFGAIRPLNRLGAASRRCRTSRPRPPLRALERIAGIARPPAPALRPRTCCAGTPPRRAGVGRAATSSSSPTRSPPTPSRPSAGRDRAAGGGGSPRAAGQRRLLRPREHLQGHADQARGKAEDGRPARARGAGRRADRGLRAVLPAHAARRAPELLPNDPRAEAVAGQARSSRS